MKILLAVLMLFLYGCDTQQKRGTIVSVEERKQGYSFPVYETTIVTKDNEQIQFISATRPAIGKELCVEDSSFLWTGTHIVFCSEESSE